MACPSDPQAPAQGGRDRRTSPRHPVEIPIEISTNRSMLIHATSDLSGKGAFFRRAIPYRVGARVQLRILLPGEEAVCCHAEVVNVPNKQDFGMGLRFLDLSPADEKRIEDFAAKNDTAAQGA